MAHGSRGFNSTYGVGATDEIDAPGFSTNHAQTVACWFYFNASTGSGMRIFSGEGTNYFRTFLYTPGATQYQIFHSWSGRTAQWHLQTNPSSGAWHQVVLIYDDTSASNNPTVYIDNAVATLVVDASPNGTPLTPADNFRIGNNNFGNRVWDGLIAHFVLDVSNLWSASDVQDHFNFGAWSLTQRDYMLPMNDAALTNLGSAGGNFSIIAGTAVVTSPQGPPVSIPKVVIATQRQTVTSSRTTALKAKVVVATQAQTVRLGKAIKALRVISQPQFVQMPRQRSGQAMGYLQARAGIARAGVTYAGWTPPNCGLQLDVSNTLIHGALLQGWHIDQKIDNQPSTCTVQIALDRMSSDFALGTYLLRRGRQLRVLYATPDDYLFSGIILSTKISITPSVQVYECRCIDWSWLIDEYALVLKTYKALSVNTMVADILATCTDPLLHYVPGYIPSSLGTLDMQFTNEKVSAALWRIAKAANAYMALSWKKEVSLYQTLPDNNAPTLRQDTVNTQLHNPTWTSDLSQTRNRSLVEGAGTTATALVPAGASLVPLSDVSAFSASGGQAHSGLNIFSYQGKTTTIGSGGTGAGYLYGCAGITSPINQNDSVTVWVQYDNVSAQTTLSGLVRNFSGRAINYLQGSTYQVGEATQRATADSTFFAGSVDTFTFDTMARWVVPGQIITVAIGYIPLVLNDGAVACWAMNDTTVPNPASVLADSGPNQLSMPFLTPGLQTAPAPIPDLQSCSFVFAAGGATPVTYQVNLHATQGTTANV